MTIGTLLDNIRTHHLEAFVDELDRCERHDLSFKTELALREADGSLILDGELELPQRIDILASKEGAPPETLQVFTEKMYGFPPITFNWSDNLKIAIKPFRWETCLVQVSGLQGRPDWSAVKEWFMKWFDPQDERREEEGFQEAVHSLSDPVQRGSDFAFEVDFGSAPIEAFDGLLDALERMGATKIGVSFEL